MLLMLAFGYNLKEGIGVGHQEAQQVIECDNAHHCALIIHHRNPPNTMFAHPRKGLRGVF